MNQNTDALFPTRITRKSYFVRGLLLILGGFVTCGMMSLSEHGSFLTKMILVGGGSALLLFLFIALFRSILIPRIRDMGLHPAWSLLIFVHALNSLFLLALLLIPANAFTKRSYPIFR